MLAPLRTVRTLTLALTTLAFVAAQADVNTPEEDKPGFIGRVLSFGKKKEEAPPPPPAPLVEEKPKPTSPGPKPKVTTIKPKSGSSSKSSATSAKKTNPAPAKKSTPAPAVVKKTEVPATKPADTEKAMAGKDSDGDGEFGHAKDDDKPEEVKPTAPVRPDVATKLPSNAGWQIVKINGRDYITGESMHQFYRFSSYKVEGKHVWFRSNNLILKGTIGSQELLINNIKFILSYPVQESSGRALFSRIDLCKLIDPVLRPTYITDGEPFDTVVVDAGHGGHDAGARGIYGYEKDFALKMAEVLKRELTRRGFKVVMTRSTDTFITLSGRVAVANSTPNSIFLSLHFNSGPNSVASGIETFALTPQGSSASLERGGGYNASGLTGNSHDSANIALATAVHAMVISKFKFVDRGIKRAQWSVLTGCKRPGILFEGGFVTNGNECRLIASDTYRQSVTSAIADAVVNYRTALRGAMTRTR
ncbi:N-acetylmuramoyl-L-alanine amidase family protein [Prosthecobacter dejongeii]|uniref:N-acetylmuramoyl-L-alanine amidase n=1 Tax=Prosthecobacter dejongeii TaxID=48465 RepID=A0A7W7YNC3_9BACT|nr:N-acetylmuramoyl-L-alanine amidase [Prosthecobacter dejongeii]MBB5039162.1 N-acetylmuramoyl-L-alanine amidase [Prosthecobacter dejongeii]